MLFHFPPPLASHLHPLPVPHHQRIPLFLSLLLQHSIPFPNIPQRILQIRSIRCRHIRSNRLHPLHPVERISHTPGLRHRYAPYPVPHAETHLLPFPSRRIPLIPIHHAIIHRAQQLPGIGKIKPGLIRRLQHIGHTPFPAEKLLCTRHHPLLKTLPQRTILPASALGRPRRRQGIINPLQLSG